jgi:HD-GYP domain-containing protein (c-di-GMP phosphodiesterase class II)
VGKCNIPDTILKKNGPLTEEEFEIIKQHPVDGAELVKGKFKDGVHKIILQHHERIDGSGYPYGLAEDEIILEAKIIAITDSFDAMTSDRAYRKAMTQEAAVQKIESLAGIYYDADIFAAFKEVLEDIRQI